MTREILFHFEIIILFFLFGLAGRDGVGCVLVLQLHEYRVMYDEFRDSHVPIWNHWR